MGYTLKLDLTDYEHGALLTMLNTELQRGERDGTTDSPFYAALHKIRYDINGYDEAVTEARKISEPGPTTA